MSFGPAKSPNWQNGLQGDIRRDLIECPLKAENLQKVTKSTDLKILPERSLIKWSQKRSLPVKKAL